jgi:PPK2 family polyphosphate:nucleotide phosphotransferase
MPRPDATDLPFPLAAIRAAEGSVWSDWQWQESKASLSEWDPGAKPFSEGKKGDDKELVELLAQQIDALQNLFFADKRYKLLLVLQGTDTAGKDGTVRGVFARTSPLGVHTVGWKEPTETELAHDFLWRIHQQIPGAGQIMVFNRSHYEDVLVPVVNSQLTPEQTRQRYAQINAFERLLAESGTVILKCLLHISKEEQRERLQQRLDDPAKHWKFSLGDLTVRKQWDAYRIAYDAALAATHTAWAPWTVVPADSKTHRNLMVATLVRDSLQALNLRFPPQDPAQAGLRVA